MWIVWDGDGDGVGDWVGDQVGWGGIGWGYRNDDNGNRVGMETSYVVMGWDRTISQAWGRGWGYKFIPVLINLTRTSSSYRPTAKYW